MTDETKHTPGPWSGCHEGNCSCGTIFGPDGNTTVARAYGEAELEKFEADCVPNKEMQAANAKLIIAAPDMLALLERVDRAFDDWADAGHMNEPKRRLWNDITAAIAKASP